MWYNYKGIKIWIGDALHRSITIDRIGCWRRSASGKKELSASGVDGEPEMRALALNAAAINTQFCGNFIRVYRGTRGPNSKQSWISTMTSIVIRDRCCFYYCFTHRGNRAEMKNGHGGSSGRPGYAKALTFLLRFNPAPWYDSIEWIFIIYTEQKNLARRQELLTYHESKIRHKYRRWRRNIEDWRSRGESN